RLAGYRLPVFRRSLRDLPDGRARGPKTRNREGLRRGAAYLAKPAGARNPSMSEFLRVGTGVLCRSRGKIDRGGGDRGGRLREARLRESSTGGRSLWLAGGRWLPPPTPPRQDRKSVV